MFQTESHKFLLYLEYAVIDEQNSDNLSSSSLYSDLEKISFFGIFIKKPKLNKRKNND